jgi:hypothetical protein
LATLLAGLIALAVAQAATRLSTPSVGSAETSVAMNCDIRWAASDFYARRLLMPRDGAIVFADLIGKLDVLYVHSTAS